VDSDKFAKVEAIPSRVELYAQMVRALHSLADDPRPLEEKVRESDRKGRERRAAGLAANGLTEDDLPDLPLISGDE
jgi:hypothetical protein